MNSGLDKLNSYKGTVYRGADLTDEIFEKYKNSLKTGKVIVEESYLSTSREEGSAFTKNTFYIIKSKNGKQVENISKFMSEKEVLFKEGSKFKVNKIYTKNGKNIIEMDEV